jgi:putative transposase
LHAKIGELTLENDFLEQPLTKALIAGRRETINREHALSITAQAMALGISRGSVYYKSRPVSAADLALMRRIDELHLQAPLRR